ncbi:hypothetical protein H6P81_000718 [Aristolochia fimbriata]|uniref:Uncharacterized protein n=1 Tax=Aristolochia fimbriata TaxID=158543 RepID=A0AAV7F4W7_ARIFI|nr:hypothetical protein H6P81_000718 [Aristolochia fimbriata]
MVYTYTPAYYSSFQDTITSICKNILPFSLKKKRLTAIAAAEQNLAKQQAENLKWQQESFHKILNLIGLHKEGIMPESEVSAFRAQLLETMVASPVDHEPAMVIRDKLQFLQELLYAKCISDDEYHSSKRPLVQRLALQGAEIDSRDVIAACPVATSNPEEEWTVIDIKDEQSLIGKESTSSKNKAKHRSPLKQIKGAVSMISSASPYKTPKTKGMKNGAAVNSTDPSEAFSNDYANMSGSSKEKSSVLENQSSVLMPQSSPPQTIKTEKEKGTDRTKKKAFRSLFGGDNGSEAEETVEKSSKKQWGFKKWKKSSTEDESTVPYLPPGERSDDVPSSTPVLVASPVGEGPNTKLIKKKILSDGSSSDFFIDKVLGDNIKKELSRIQGELSAGNQNLCFSDEQIEAISTRLPVDKTDLKKFFPKSWCDRYGEIVLDVVRKEFKDHVGEMETLRNATREKRRISSARWVAFGEDENENCHPNLFSTSPSSGRRMKEDDYYFSGNDNKSYTNNPFYDDKPESAFFRDLNQNPFWNSSTMMG